MKYLFILLFVTPIFLHANVEKNIHSKNPITNGLDTLETKNSIHKQKKTYIYALLSTVHIVRIFKSNQSYVKLSFENAIERLTATEREILINPETGKVKEFENLLSAMNCMAALGWELTQTYVETTNFKPTDPTNNITWVIKRENIE